MRSRFSLIAAPVLGLISAGLVWAGLSAATGAGPWAKLAQKPSGQSEPTATTTRATRNSADTPGKTNSRRNPAVDYQESLRVFSRRIPLYGPIHDEDGSSDRKLYVYPAVVRVISYTYDTVSHVLRLVLDFTAPEIALEEAKSRIEADTKANAHIVPLLFDSYAITVRGSEPGEERTWTETAGAETGFIVPTNRKSIEWIVPETMTHLRQQLTTEPETVSLRFIGKYDFERVAFGRVSVGLVGRVSRDVLEEVHPSKFDTQASVFWVDRRTRDRVKTRINQGITQTDINVGLSSEDWAAIRDEKARSADHYFDRLPAYNLAKLMDDTDVSVIYTASGGKVEAKPLITKNQVALHERAEAYESRLRQDLKVLQDVLRKGSIDRKSHKDLRDKLSIDGKIDVGIKLIRGSASLKLDKESSQLTDDELKIMNDNRDYWLSDSKLEQDIKSGVQEKVQGDMNEEKTMAKTLEIYRIDEREISARTGASGSHVKLLGYERVAILTESGLRIDGNDDAAALIRRVRDLEKSNNSLLIANERLIKDFSQTRGAIGGFKNDLLAERARSEKVKADLKNINTRLTGVVGDVAALKQSDIIKIASFDMVFVGVNSNIPPNGWHQYLSNSNTEWVPDQTFGREVKAVTWEPVHCVDQSALHVVLPGGPASEPDQGEGLCDRRQDPGPGPLHRLLLGLNEGSAFRPQWNMLAGPERRVLSSRVN